MMQVAVVGAGVSGLGTAYGLRTDPVDVTIFEKSRGFGGRAATRGRHGHRYDHGARYFTATSKRVRRIVTAHLPTAGLVEIGRPVWRFSEEDGFVQAETGGESPSRLTYYQGISQLAKLLVQESGASVHRRTRIQTIQRRGATWAVIEEDGTVYAPFDAVLLTPPAPQTAALIPTGSETGAWGLRLQRAIRAVQYTAQFSYVFAYDRSVGRPGSFFGLEVEDADYPISWIGYENDKPGHVREGHSVLIVQTSPCWTQPRVDQSPEEFVPDIMERAEDILVADLRSPTWYDVQRWRYAIPQSALDSDMLSVAAKRGLFLAGDYVTGDGQIEAALETGLDAAGAIREMGIE